MTTNWWRTHMKSSRTRCCGRRRFRKPQLSRNRLHSKQNLSQLAICWSYITLAVKGSEGSWLINHSSFNVHVEHLVAMHRDCRVSVLQRERWILWKPPSSPHHRRLSADSSVSSPVGLLLLCTLQVVSVLVCKWAWLHKCHERLSQPVQAYCFLP